MCMWFAPFPLCTSFAFLFSLVRLACSLGFPIFPTSFGFIFQILFSCRLLPLYTHKHNIHLEFDVFVSYEPAEWESYMQFAHCILWCGCVYMCVCVCVARDCNWTHTHTSSTLKLELELDLDHTAIGHNLLSSFRWCHSMHQKYIFMKSDKLCTHTECIKNERGRSSSSSSGGRKKSIQSLA